MSGRRLAARPRDISLTRRRAALVAWALAGVALVLLACGLVLRLSLSQAWLLPISSSFALVGALIASRRPENPIGWLFLGFGVLAAIDFAAYQYANRALVTHPGSLPGGNVAISVADHVWHPGFGLFVFSFLLFPNGRLVSPRWRWAARATVLTYGGLAVSGIFEAGFLKAEEDLPAKPLFHGPVENIASVVFGLLLFANLALLVVAGMSLVLRLKRSRGEERQQVKWFVYTVAFVMFFFPVSLFGLGQAYGVALFPLIPASAAVAILKYRLYDIDVVVNRTLVYGALTATLAGAYLASVLVLQLVLSPSSDLAIAASTLAVAALFRPARSRIQELVDRRFYRRKYDAAQTLEHFGARLRDEVNLQAVNAELSAIVRETLQPAHVSIWLRTPEARR
jgi:hypothetical protein